MEATTTEAEFLTTTEAGRLVGHSAQTIINWCDEDRFVYQRIGTGPRRISRISFLAYCSANGVTPKVA